MPVLPLAPGTDIRPGKLLLLFAMQLKGIRKRFIFTDPLDAITVGCMSDDLDMSY